MSQAGEIREFLVKVGYDIDQRSVRDYEAATRKATMQGFLLADALKSAAKQVAEAIRNITNSYADLFYQSQRSGTPVQSIQAFEFAAKQMGAAGEGTATLQRFAANKRMFNVAEGLKSLGVDPRGKDDAQVIEESVRSVRGLPWNQQKNRLAFLSMSDNLLMGMLRGDEFHRWEDEFKKAQREAGLDPQSAAGKAVEFQRAVNALFEDIRIIFGKVGIALADSGVIEKLTRWIEDHAKDFTKALTDIGLAIVGIVTSIVEHLPRIADFADRVSQWLGGSKSLGESLDRVGSYIDPEKDGSFGQALRALSKVEMPDWLKWLLSSGQAKADTLTNGAWTPGSDSMGMKRAWATGNQGGMTADGGVRNEHMLRPGHMSEDARRNAKESWDFWKSRGYSDEAAAAMLAQEQGESNFNPAARGDAGRGHGLFQHHPDRRSDILSGSGINVSTASHLDQLKAAAWEQERGRDQGARAAGRILRSTRDVHEATRAGVALFERPLDTRGAMWTREGFARHWMKEFGGKGAAQAVPDKPLTSSPLPPARPLGSQSMNWQMRKTNLAANAKIFVNGASDPEATARAIQGAQGRITSDWTGKVKEAMA